MLTKEEVAKIANLARLELAPGEVEFFQQKLSRILDYMNELSQVKTGPDDVARHVPSDAKGLREDKKAPFEASGELLENAPATSENQFLLPTVLD